MDETGEQSSMKEIGKFWEIPEVPEELSEMNFIQHKQIEIKN